MTLTSSFAQKITKTDHYKFKVNENIAIEINSKYTNIEFELTDNNSIQIETIMEVEGLSENEVDTYFKQWNFKANKNKNKIVINSSLNTNKPIQKKGYYKGYFIEGETLSDSKAGVEKLNKGLGISKKNNIKNQGEFDFKSYIKNGNAYLKQWEKENNEPIGKRFYNKTKAERIQLQKPQKKILPNLGEKPKVINKDLLKRKNEIPQNNVRKLSKRATVNKTLKIKIPRDVKLVVNARHGKVEFLNEVKNLIANLSYVLLKATKISGEKTLIKGKYSNFEINQWQNGKIDVLFSGFVLINKAKKIDITSNTSTVSIDAVTESISAKGNFKMLSVDALSSIKNININVEDSKKVWLKLPKTIYNLFYEGVNSKLIHPEKFILKTTQNNPKKQQIVHTSIHKNTPKVTIKALYSTMQIYDIPWENLAIKNI